MNLTFHFVDHKTPEGNIVVPIDWTDWLNGAAIVSSVWSVEGPGSPLATLSGESFTDTAPSVYVAGGDQGRSYRIINDITTATESARRVVLMRIR